MAQLAAGAVVQDSREAHLSETELFCSQPQRDTQYMAYDRPAHAVGLVEASLRTDYVNGTSTAPVTGAQVTGIG